MDKTAYIYASAAIAATLALIATPQEQVILPLSEQDAIALGTANLYISDIKEFQLLRLNQKSTVDLGLYEVISERRKLVEEYQIEALLRHKDLKVNSEEYSLAISVVEEYKKASLLLAQNEGNTGGTGTAFMISEELALTNAHNINALDGTVPAGLTFSLTDYDGNKYSAEVLGVDGAADIALLKLDSPAVGLPYLGIEDWDTSFKEDEVVVSVGNAGALGVWTPLIGRNIEALPFDGIETGIASLNVSTGSSGSPVFGLDGKLKGIVYASSVNTAKEKNYSAERVELESYLLLTESVFYLTSAEILERVKLWTK